VTRFFKIFSIVIIATILILVIIGVMAPTNTYFTRTQIIKSPVSVVWRILVDVENYPSWQLSVNKVVLKNGSYPGEGKILCFYMTDYNTDVFHEAEITKYEDDKAFTYVRIGVNVSSLLKEYQTAYSLKRLLDGTTEVSVITSYRTIGFITKIYNQIYLRGKLGTHSDRNLRRLKDSIEKM